MKSVVENQFQFKRFSKSITQRNLIDFSSLSLLIIEKSHLVSRRWRNIFSY